jgi:hypothetical protein
MNTTQDPVSKFLEVPQELGDIFWHAPFEKGDWSIVKPSGLKVTNYVLNPSFEYNTIGWIESATATLLRQAGGTHGGYRAKLTGIGPGVFDVQYTGAVFTVGNGSTIYGSVDIFAHANTQVSVSFERHPTSSLPTDSTFSYSSAIFTGQERWQRVYFTATSRSDGTTPTQLAVLIEATPILNQVSTDIFIDALRVSDLDHWGYFDGDSPGGVWTGGQHSSASQIDRFNRQYGSRYNFNENGWSFISDEGAGLPTIENNTTSYAQGQGSHLNNVRSTERKITLTFQGDFDTDDELTQAINSLIDAMTWPYEDICTQEFLLIYQRVDDCGNEITNALSIPVSYSDGLQLSRKAPGVARIALQFTANEDPFFTAQFELTNSIILDSSGAVASISRFNIGQVVSPLTIEFRPTSANSTLTSFTNAFTGRQLVFTNANGSTPLNFVSNLILGTDARRSYFVRAFNKSNIMNLIDYSNSDLGTVTANPGSCQFDIVGQDVEVIVRWRPRYKTIGGVSCRLGP